MQHFDVITVGESTFDIFLTANDQNKHFRLDPKTKELCVKFGDKAVIDQSHFAVGGNATNVAVGLRRMGFSVSVSSEIGDDDFSKKILDVIDHEGISKFLLKQTKDSVSSFSVILNYKNDRTIFVEDFKREHNFSFDDVLSNWVYLTSLGEEWEGAYQKTLEHVLKNNLKLAFNPGQNQLDKGVAYLSEIFKNTNILFLNKEESESLLQINAQNKDIEEILLGLLELGPKTVVITDGVNGSFAMDFNKKIYHQEIFKTPIIERTGAGDAYASGFLSAILLGKNINDAMKFGAENASSVISKIGAQAGLLTKDEMLKKLEL
jgi:ribokinase